MHISFDDVIINDRTTKKYDESSATGGVSGNAQKRHKEDEALFLSSTTNRNEGATISATTQNEGKNIFGQSPKAAVVTSAVDRAVKNLHIALQKESDQWREWAFLGLYQGSASEDLVTSDQRDSVGHWIYQVARQQKFGMTTRTVCLSLTMLDKILFTTTVQAKYLKCVALACLFIGAKISEETEDTPLCRELVREAGCLFSVCELIRMERVLLQQRLKWDLNFVTVDTFLHSMLAIVAPEHIRLDLYLQFADLQRMVTCSYRLASAYKPSLLALSILSLTLGRLRSAGRASIISRLKRLLDVSDEKFFDCYNSVANHWRLRPDVVGACDENRTPQSPLFQPIGIEYAYNNELINDDVIGVGAQSGNSPEQQQQKRKGRKRQRQKSMNKSFSYSNSNSNPSFCDQQEAMATIFVSRPNKTKSNPVNIDEIYDSVHFLYDNNTGP